MCPAVRIAQSYAVSSSYAVAASVHVCQLSVAQLSCTFASSTCRALFCILHNMVPSYCSC